MPEYAFTDSSFLVAGFNVRDRGHHAAIEFLEGKRERVRTPSVWSSATTSSTRP